MASINCIISWGQGGRGMHTERLRARTSPVNLASWLWAGWSTENMSSRWCNDVMPDYQPTSSHSTAFYQPGLPLERQTLSLMSPSVKHGLGCQLGCWSDWFVAENLHSLINTGEIGEPGETEIYNDGGVVSFCIQSSSPGSLLFTIHHRGGLLSVALDLSPGWWRDVIK